jgi:hypothetical protein
LRTSITTEEDDLTYLPEILEKHDLSLDPGAGTHPNSSTSGPWTISPTVASATMSSIENFRELLERTGFYVRSMDLAYPFHICTLATPYA